MLKVLLFLILIITPLTAAVPVSETIGRIQTAVEEDSLTAIALEAAAEEYTEAWLDEYAVDKITFGEAYSALLSETLPLSNIIAGTEKNGAVTLKSLSDGTVITFIFLDGKINAVSLSP